ncbi:hypothetical protein D5086_006475 [Populus alba]|uniref:Uncharacterized protein n=1 Tax=Populus alba TaxID=43335 RepID=A0ACC4CM72_POPAL
MIQSTFSNLLGSQSKMVNQDCIGTGPSCPKMDVPLNSNFAIIVSSSVDPAFVYKYGSCTENFIECPPVVPSQAILVCTIPISSQV